MKQNHRAETILIELVLVILLFMLASTMVVRIFAETKLDSERAGIRSAALTEAENLADRMLTAGSPTTVAEESGLIPEGAIWKLDRERYSLTVTFEPEKTAAGTLNHITITGLYREEPLFTLPCDRYDPEVVNE